MSKPVTAIIVGAGHRALCYASLAEKQPESLKIVGVADPLGYRREEVAARFGLTPEQCYETAEELAAKGKLADTIINGTMDAQHVPTTIPLVEAGYDVLLEKPFAVSVEEVRQLEAVVNKHDAKVMICHILRYAPFYRRIREIVEAGTIGTILNVQTTEHVSYHHMAMGFVRGKWANEAACKSSMLMAKCCHDMDLLTWMKSGIAPVKVSSFGSRMYFREEMAPEGAGTQCMVDCPIEASCHYSAKQQYLDHPIRWSSYTWDKLEGQGEISLAQKEAFLKDPSNPYGRCVWKLDNDVVDHQSVMVEYADGATGTHNLVGGTSRPCRTIRLMGTLGEIEGDHEAEKIIIRHPDTRPGHEYTEEHISLDVEGDHSGAFGGHGGGDLRMVIDFVATVRGAKPSISCTSLADSINGHMIGFLADQSRRENRVISC